MKLFRILLIVLMVILGSALFGLQWFLTQGLTPTLNQRIFPAVLSQYGLDMSVTHAAVNLFTGTATLNGFAVRNPQGYEEPDLLTVEQCRLQIELRSLFKHNPVVIKLAEVEGGTLVLEQSQDRQFNVLKLAETLKLAHHPEGSAPQQQPSPQPPPAPQSAPSAPAAIAPSIPVQIRRIAMDVLVKYVDSKRQKEYDVKLRLTGSDLFTVPAKGQPNSLLVLRGSLAHNQDVYVTDLNAILEPLTDPRHPSFSATGSILNIDATWIGDLLKKNEMESRSFSIRPAITCAEGRLKDSRLDLILNDLKIYDTSLGDTTIKLPLNGTLQHPTMDITGAIQTLFVEQGVKIGKAIGLRALQKNLGASAQSAPQELLLHGLTNHVKAIAKSPTLRGLIQQVVQRGVSADLAVTNPPTQEAVEKALFEQLGTQSQTKENDLGVQEALKNLNDSLLGK